MIDAEKWYEFERDYQKYGLDMQPERVRPKRRRRRLAINPDARNRAASRKVAFSTVVILGALCIFMIMVTAFCASMQYDINKINKENTAIEGEIENLQAKVYASSNISVVESTATDEMNMKYPSEKKRVYLYNDDVPEDGFASVLRDKAYE